MGEGRQWLDMVEGELKDSPDVQAADSPFEITEELLTKVRHAAQSYERALTERPSSEEARSAQVLAQALSQGLEHYGSQRWDQSVAELQGIYEENPDYLSGRVIAILCDAHLHLGDSLFQEEDYEAALAAYQAMIGMEECDVGLAQTKIWEAGIPLTPTATPTLTATPTHTATPTATQTPTPTATEQPAPTDTPVPAGPSDPPKPKPSNTPVPEPTPIPTLDIPPR